MVWVSTDFVSRPTCKGQFIGSTVYYDTCSVYISIYIRIYIYIGDIFSRMAYPKKDVHHFLWDGSSRLICFETYIMYGSSVCFSSLQKFTSVEVLGPNLVTYRIVYRCIFILRFFR